jgi:predicted nucleic acid-binding protein
MSDKYFVDTNILVYAHDLKQGAKYEGRERWYKNCGRAKTEC